MGADWMKRLRLLLWAGALCGLAVAGLVLFLVTVVGAAAMLVWVGLPILFATVLVVRPLAQLARRVAGAVLGQPIASPYLKAPTGNLFARLRGYVRDPATWRDALWLLVNGTVGLVLALLGLVEGVLDLVFWWLPPGMLVRADAYLVRALLAPNETTSLAQRVQAAHRVEGRDRGHLRPPSCAASSATCTTGPRPGWSRWA